MTSINATIRSFVAIELTEEVKSVLLNAQDAMRESMGAGASAVRWVRPESTHLTLQFLGDVPVRVLPAVQDAIRRGCAGTSPFSLEVGGLGVFPNQRRPRVVWVGLRGDEGDMETLHRLQTSIADALKPLGFKPDKEFHPHLTLGRVREGARQDDYASIARAVSNTLVPQLAAPFRVDAISLMRSELRPAGSIYTQTAVFELAQS